MKRQRNKSQRTLTVQHDSTDSWNEKRYGRRRDCSSKESSQNSFSVDRPVAFGFWKESDAGLRRYAVRISKQCEEHVCQPDVKVTEPVSFVPTTMVKLWRSLKITGTNNETTRIVKTGVPTRRHKSKKPWTERVIHTKVFNRSKRNQVESRDTR